MSAPLPPPDPRFPDRPANRDFWRLSHILIDNDLPGRNFAELVKSIIESDTLKYVSLQRARMAAARKKAGAPETTVLQAVWIDGFLAGARFQQERGHQE